MATDYILFIHGVNTPDDGEPPTYANSLFNLIASSIARSHQRNSPPRDIKKVVLYWGNLTANAEQALLAEYEKSDVWKQFWYRRLRSGMFMKFAGDAALYISPYVGAKVASTLHRQTEQGLGKLEGRNSETGDRLHLVTHSLGTVVLFDLFFSARWNPPAPGHQYAMSLRNVVYGIEPNWHQGIYLASITTMGSPLGLFKLLDTSSSDETHDIMPHMKRMLSRLTMNLKSTENKLPWLNFVHPGDPIACPLKPLILTMVDPEQRYLDVQDILVSGTTLFDKAARLLRNTSLGLIDGGHAHLSYLTDKHVAENIAQTIVRAAPAEVTL